jgi:serine/threonine-protein kinase
LDVTPMLHLLRPLGEGGMGKVWVARHKGLETDVVVKFLAAEGADRAEAEARFAREAAAAAAVKSPHVVQVFDHGVTANGTRYIVMELLEGRDLAMHLAANGAMSPRDVAAVIAQAAKALSKAHQAGVIHRDIKPENVFLCDGDGGEMFVKVLDFGIAKREQQVTSKTTTGQVVGTPYYMSPEQILGERPIDLRTDIWSLGVVAFEALTGKRPFDGATVGSITLAIHQSTPRPSALVPTIPAALDGWFARACARVPEDRFATVREAGQAILVAVGDPLTTSGMFRPPLMSVADTSDPSLVAHLAPTPETQNRSVTSLSSSVAAEPSPRRSPPKLLLAGGLLVVVLLGALVVVAARRAPEAASAAREPPSAHAALASAMTTSAPEPSATPTVAPPVPSSSVSASAHPAESAARPKGTGTGRGTVSTGTRGTRAPRPARKPNDDDIK